jgi:hypothetical protein
MIQFYPASFALALPNLRRLLTGSPHASPVAPAPAPAFPRQAQSSGDWGRAKTWWNLWGHSWGNIRDKASGQSLGRSKFIPIIILALSLWVGMTSLSSNARANPYRPFVSHERERHHAPTVPYHNRHQMPFFGPHHPPHHHHHPRCRERLVPYWNAYWQMWSERLERVCW